MKRLPFVLIISGLTGILFLGAFWTSVAQADSKRNFTVEVAVSTRGVNFADFPIPMGAGTVVLARGNIYRKGTLPSGASDFDPSTPGELGIWRCHFLALDARGDPNPIDFPLIGAVTYYFQLQPTGNSKESMIIVQGLNSHTFPNGVPRVLAIVGGTGKYAGATGVVREKVLGTNMSGSVNVRFRFRLRGVGDDDD